MHLRQHFVAITASAVAVGIAVAAVVASVAVVRDSMEITIEPEAASVVGLQLG